VDRATQAFERCWRALRERTLERKKPPGAVMGVTLPEGKLNWDTLAGFRALVELASQFFEELNPRCSFLRARCQFSRAMFGRSSHPRGRYL